MRRHRRRHLPSKWIFVLLFILFGMGIGYAAISTTLTIDGTSDIDSARWNIYFDNVQVTSGSVTADLPVITDNTTVSFSANLENPGDFYEFKVDVINDGTLDAKLDAITILPVLTQAQQNYFKYTVTYEDGIDISVDDSLAAGATETLIIRCEYLVQSDTSLYPTEDTTLNFSVSMTYTQGHGNVRDRFVYNVSTTRFFLGENPPTGVTTYNTPQAAITAFGYPFFLKHKISNNVITESYVGFEYNGNIYYIRAYKSNSNSSTDNPYYENNKQILQNAFGVSKCTESIAYNNNASYECTDNVVIVRTLTNGIASAYNSYTSDHNTYICYIDYSGYSRCGIDDG